MRNELDNIRKMTLQNPEEFYPQLKELLLECGIVLVGLPALKNANLQGATKKFKNNSVLVLMTDRNKKSDIFWFSLFHELGHILNDDFCSNLSDIESYHEKERKADEFAMELLIPQREYEKFIGSESFRRYDIVIFANKISIHPSIVVGRLQNDKKIDFSSFSDLRKSYNFDMN